MVEQKVGNYGTPYQYTGQELDANTGLYNYGARYYDPRVSLFFGVDPLASKYPGHSPYTYTFNNPIRYNDPTGMEGEEGGPDDPPSEKDGWTGEYTNKAKTQHTWTKGNRQIQQKYVDGEWKQNEIDLRQTGTGDGLSLDPSAGGYDSEFANQVSDIASEMILSALLNVAMPGIMMESSAFRSYKAVGSASKISKSSAPLNNFVSNYSLKTIPRAPKGGMFVKGKFYKGGQFIPGKRTVMQFGRGSISNYNSVPALSSPLRPTPMNFSIYNESIRKAIGWGGAGLGFTYGTSKILNK